MSIIRTVVQAAAGRVVSALAGAVLATAVINPCQQGAVGVATSVKEPLANFAPAIGVPSAADGADDAIGPDAVDAAGGSSPSSGLQARVTSPSSTPTQGGAAAPTDDASGWSADTNEPTDDASGWSADTNEPTGVASGWSADADELTDDANDWSADANGPTGVGVAPNAPTVDVYDWPADAAVNFAMAQIGKPYVYGATGPDSYDCSGLVQAAWAAAGVTIPRTTYEQAAQLDQVPEYNLRPGDLVLYYGGSHVGMYIGGGMVVHAPTEGDVVKKSPYASMPVWKVVRPR